MEKKIIREFIRTFMSTAFKEEGFNDEIQDNDSLVDLGSLDSLGMLRLIDFLDEEFSIFPGENDFHPEKYDSVHAIIDFIEKNRSH